MQQGFYVTWSTLGVLIGAIGAITAGASAYLRWFFKAQMLEQREGFGLQLVAQEKRLLEEIKTEYITKESYDLKLEIMRLEHKNLVTFVERMNTELIKLGAKMS